MDLPIHTPGVFEKLAVGALPEIITLIVSVAEQLFTLFTVSQYFPEVLITKESVVLLVDHK
jgi:hypothetical protein